MADAGLAVFSNAKNHRYDSHVPILIPLVLIKCLDYSDMRSFRSIQIILTRFESSRHFPNRKVCFSFAMPSSSKIENFVMSTNEIRLVLKLAAPFPVEIAYFRS